MIKEYLKAVRDIQYSEKAKEYYNWILKNIEIFDGENRDIDKENELMEKACIPIKPKLCFYQSQLLLLMDDDFEYYEGWYVVGNMDIPLEHGFLVYNGKVVDVTSRASGFIIQEYGGVKIPRDYVESFLLKSHFSTQLLPEYYFECIKLP